MKYTPVIAICVSAVLVLAIIIFSANVPNKKNNGFYRHFIKEPLSLEKSLKISQEIRGVIGQKGKTIFFSTNNPSKLLSISMDLGKIQESNLNLSSELINKIGNVYTMHLEYPLVYIFADRIPAILTVSLISNKITVINIPPPYFTRALYISPNSFILRKFDSEIKDQIFVKYIMPEGKLVKEHNLSEVNRDGGLSTDGYFNYDYKNGLITFLHNYSNKIVTFDTNFKLIKRFQAIDTFNNPVVTLGIQNENKLEVNKTTNFKLYQTSCATKNHLIICSNLRADNESKKQYWNNIPVDIYSTPTGKYEGSFYLPLSNRDLVKKIQIFDDKLIAVYPNQVSIFSINLNP